MPSPEKDGMTADWSPIGHTPGDGADARKPYGIEERARGRASMGIAALSRMAR